MGAGLLTAIAKSHCSPLTVAFTRPDFLQRLLGCAFAPSICVLVRCSWTCLGAAADIWPAG